MYRVSQSIQVDRPASDVWPYLIAFEQVPLWEHGIVEVRQITPGAPGIGTELFAKRLFAGRETRLTGGIVAFEDGRSATLAFRGGPSRTPSPNTRSTRSTMADRWSPSAHAVISSVPCASCTRFCR